MSIKIWCTPMCPLVPGDIVMFTDAWYTVTKAAPYGVQHGVAGVSTNNGSLIVVDVYDGVQFDGNGRVKSPMTLSATGSPQYQQTVSGWTRKPAMTPPPSSVKAEDMTIQLPDIQVSTEVVAQVASEGWLFACRTYGCPERPPQHALVAPVCYTCGRRMDLS